MQKIPILKDLNEKDHLQIIQNIKVEFFAGDYLIFNQGDAPDGLYIIETGRVRIFHPQPDDGFQEVAVLGDYDFFGEMALISEKTRSASAITLEETVTFMLKKRDFEELIIKDAEMASRISREFMQRLEKMCVGKGIDMVGGEINLWLALLAIWLVCQRQCRCPKERKSSDR